MVVITNSEQAPMFCDDEYRVQPLTLAVENNKCPVSAEQAPSASILWLQWTLQWGIT